MQLVRALVCSLVWLVAAAAPSHWTAAAFKISVSIPQLVKLNEAFWLNCSREPAVDYRQIYAIKWYKDEEEFYRFLPNAEPRVSTFDTAGVQLDQTKSHDGNVFLSKADVNSEGNYRCEILSEAPLFETVRKSGQLKVYALPIRGPRIDILDENGKPKSYKTQGISYSVGDNIELRCSSAPSKPAARLRWFMNDREIVNTTANAIGNRKAQLRDRTSGRSDGYDIQLGQVEFRQHYKAIYSTHMTLTLILKEEDLVSGRMGFKCLASMRQEISVSSKQLIVVAKPQSQLQRADRRGKRWLAPMGLSEQPDGGLKLLLANSEHNANEQHPRQRHRVQYNRQPAPSVALKANKSPLRQSPSDLTSTFAARSLQLQEAADAKYPEALYIHEASDSTLGPSIIDTFESLLSYVANDSHREQWFQRHQQSRADEQANEFNQGDNMDYVQIIRDRLARQRSLPSQSNYGYANHSAHHYMKRPLYQSNSLVRSPLHIDELDQLRPILSWPPFDGGRLTLVPVPNQRHSPSIAALPLLLPPATSWPSSTGFILPPGGDRATDDDQESIEQRRRLSPAQNFLIIVEKLIENLNCTSLENSLDTKLSWIINDIQLDARDVRFHSTRAKSDADHQHRQQQQQQQVWQTVGIELNRRTKTAQTQQLHDPAHANHINDILAPYYSKAAAAMAAAMQEANQEPSETTTRPGNFMASDRSSSGSSTVGVGGQHQDSNGQKLAAAQTSEQIRFTCQASHSMLLFSSSESITFDFNPPLRGSDGNSLDDKLSDSASGNIIQAAPASQRSSASGSLPGWWPGSCSLLSSGSLALLIAIATLLPTSLSLH